jgi:transcriptional antiterminator RfaH
MAAAWRRGEKPLSTKTTTHWYAVHTKPRQESMARSSLQREGIETFYPKLRRKKTVRRKYRWVSGPLFPSYIFARFDLATSARLVKYATGVTNIVSFGGKPALVDESIVNAIADHCEDDVVTLAPPELRAGDVVEIQEGPLRGLKGIFERELSDSERVVILLQSIAAAARVEVSREHLEKL